MDARVEPGHDEKKEVTTMAMYDNLLANVPTDLWIGGKWRKASDGARFTRSTIRSTLGSARSSRISAAGSGICGVVIRTGGASRS